MQPTPEQLSTLGEDKLRALHADTRESLDDCSLERARTNLSAYGRVVHEWSYKPRHIQRIITELHRVALGKTNRLLISAPPRHAKTNWAVVAFSGFYLGIFPNRRILHVCDTGHQAKLNSIIIRDTIRSNAQYRRVFPSALPDEAKPQTDVEWFLLRQQESKDPSFAAYGAGGPILGRGADLLLVDDANNEENSRTSYQRTKLWDWYVSKVQSRVEPGGARVVIQHRWHKQDLIGKLKETEGDRWRKVELPAIDAADNALWPSLWPRKLLEEQRRLNPLLFEALWQGRPEALSGQIIQGDWLQSVPADFKPVRAVLGVDVAVSKKTTADYTVIVLLAFDATNRVALLDLTRGRLSITEQMSEITLAFERGNKMLARHEVEIESIGIESVAYQAVLPQLMRATTMLPIIGVNVNKDKVTRAQGWLGRAQVEEFFVDQTAEWWPDFLTEAVEFGDRAEHDDQIDAVSVAWVAAGEATGIELFAL